MRLFFRTSLILFLVATIFACGEEVDPIAPFACEIYDPSQAKKYAKPTTPEEQRQFTKCIPRDAGVVQYHPIEKPAMIVKLQNSRKMMQLKFSVMTKHDEFALMRVQKNEQALRAAFNERMLMISEEDTNRPEFRNELRNDLKVVANDTMRRIEGYDFDIVEEVLLTSYVVE